MGEPVAKEGDRIVGMDVHIEIASQIPVPMPHSFSGPLNQNLASAVFVDGHAVAVLGSTADNSPSHMPQSGPFQNTPRDKGEIADASSTVYAGGVRVARNNDPATTCNDVGLERQSHVVASGSVYSG